MDFLQQCLFFILFVALPIRAEHSRQKRVIGGQPAKANSVPWIVNFNVQSKKPQQCSGNLINSEWIITTAHCFNSFSLSDFTLTAGDHYMNKKDRYEKELRADQVFIHPSFLPAPYHDRHPGDFDIALIHLSSKVNFTDKIRPIRLPNAATSFPEGHLCKISGWGNVVKESKYKRSVVLRQTEVKLVSREACNSNESYNGVIPESFLCAGYKEGGRDACYGDSGGPLQCKNADGEWVLIGIVAWGKGCANPNKYGVYTDIKEIMPFVHSIINDEKGAEARKIVNDSIWRSSKIFNTSIEKMAREVHTTPDKLLQISLKHTFSTLLRIEKNLIIKRMVSRLAISACVMDKCFLAKEARVFAGKIEIDHFDNKQNILAVLRNQKCFLRFASLEILEKLSKISLKCHYNLDLISLARKFFKNTVSEEILGNLELFPSLKNYNISEINRLLSKYKKPALRNLTISEAVMHVLSIITATDLCKSSAHNCSSMSACHPYPRGFYCDSSTSDTASDAQYKIMTIVLGLVSLCLLVTVASLFMYIMSRKKRGSYQEVPLNGSMSQKKTVPDHAHA